MPAIEFSGGEPSALQLATLRQKLARMGQAVDCEGVNTRGFCIEEELTEALKARITTVLREALPGIEVVDETDGH
ncbi:MAG TPA: hypothetical protein VFZ48_03190 [Candidatus Saccharimonadales bacterium]